MPARRPVAAAPAAVSGCATSVPSTISGSRPRRRVRPERLDHRVVVGAGAEIAEGQARLGGIGRAHAGQVQVEPVLAVQRRPRRGRAAPGSVALHLRHLRALLAGVEPGARSPRTARAPAGRRRARATVGAARASSQSQASVDRRVPGADQPGSVALRGHGDRRGPPREVLDLVAETAHRLRAVGPGLGQRLPGRAVRAGAVAVRRPPPTRSAARRDRRRPPSPPRCPNRSRSGCRRPRASGAGPCGVAIRRVPGIGLSGALAAWRLPLLCGRAAARPSRASLLPGPSRPRRICHYVSQ